MRHKACRAHRKRFHATTCAHALCTARQTDGYFEENLQPLCCVEISPYWRSGAGRQIAVSIPSLLFEVHIFHPAVSRDVLANLPLPTHR
jgi:hypothetical protein